MRKLMTVVGCIALPFITYFLISWLIKVIPKFYAWLNLFSWWNDSYFILFVAGIALAFLVLSMQDGNENKECSDYDLQ